MAFITFSFQPPSTGKRNLMVTLEGRSRWKGGCCTETSLPAPRMSPWDPASHLGTTVEPLPQPGVGQQILRWQILNLWKVTVAAELSYLLIQPRGGQKPHNQLENNTLHSVSRDGGTHFSTLGQEGPKPITHFLTTTCMAAPDIQAGLVYTKTTRLMLPRENPKANTPVKPLPDVNPRVQSIHISKNQDSLEKSF